MFGIAVKCYLLAGGTLGFCMPSAARRIIAAAVFANRFSEGANRQQDVTEGTRSSWRCGQVTVDL